MNIDFVVVTYAFYLAIEAGSEEARRRFPSLKVGATLEELRVVGRRGWTR
jgi:hypothetical protein